MESISPRGAQMASMGRVDLLLYKGLTKEAIALLQQESLSASGKADDSALAEHLILLAEAKLSAGKASEAAADAKSALGHDSGGVVEFSVGRIYVEAGQLAPAQALA